MCRKEWVLRAFSRKFEHHFFTSITNNIENSLKLQKPIKSFIFHFLSAKKSKSVADCSKITRAKPHCTPPKANVIHSLHIIKSNTFRNQQSKYFFFSSVCYQFGFSDRIYCGIDVCLTGKMARTEFKRNCWYGEVMLTVPTCRSWEEPDISLYGFTSYDKWRTSTRGNRSHLAYATCNFILHAVHRRQRTIDFRRFDAEAIWSSSKIVFPSQVSVTKLSSYQRKSPTPRVSDRQASNGIPWKKNFKRFSLRWDWTVQLTGY